MRKALVLLGALASAAMLAGVASGGVGGGTVAGSGFFNASFDGGTFAAHIIVGAHGGPAGATGHVAMVVGGTRYDASVDCIIVVGNSAYVVGTLREPVGSYTELIVEIVDNGSGVPDAGLGGLSEPEPFAPCSGTVFFTDVLPVERGNFVVHG